MNPYESPRLLAEYLLLHYGGVKDVLDGMPSPADAVGFPVRLVRELLAPVPDDARALDLGCAVGSSSFELARSCGEVLGIDFSQSFIDAANHLRETGEHVFEKPIEGDLTEPSIARVPPEIDRARVTFEQGDACDLGFHPKPSAARQPLTSSCDSERQFFDMVLAANLLCRLPDPMRLIERLPTLVTPGGQLLLTTPFTWLEEFTPRENWIGGTAASGRSFDALRALLDPHFALEHVADLPFLIREHSRKFQYGIACGSRWRRR